jgi:hypothetical protein
MAQHSSISSDERILFFPTYGWQRDGDDGTWTFPIHGWVYEPEEDSIRRRLLLNSLCHSLSLSDEACGTDIFVSRAQYFLADNERGKSIPIEIINQVTLSGLSGNEGHFRAELRITASQLELLRISSEGGWIRFRARTKPGDDRIFEGRTLPLERSGLSVISDIDDTIKDSRVNNRKELLNNTFVRPFRPIPGMAELYRAWAAKGAAFHYLSASPWQLYAPLAEFLARERLPEGSFHLKEFRWKDSRFFDLFTSPEKWKTPILESILETFPNRRYLFVGDSGEKDPEIYGEIARRFPKHDIRILIREFPGVPLDTVRRAAAFSFLAPERWRIVDDATIQSEPSRERLTEFAIDQ